MSRLRVVPLLFLVIGVGLLGGFVPPTQQRKPPQGLAGPVIRLDEHPRQDIGDLADLPDELLQFVQVVTPGVLLVRIAVEQGREARTAR